ncbi:MAG: hypothetical protein FJ137_18530 [Deltaproteobacteria bacterium]|nr:hypothetical protein [Deltaproteobacteria bacterium]
MSALHQTKLGENPSMVEVSPAVPPFSVNRELPKAFHPLPPLARVWHVLQLFLEPLGNLAWNVLNAAAGAATAKTPASSALRVTSKTDFIDPPRGGRTSTRGAS